MITFNYLVEKPRSTLNQEDKDLRTTTLWPLVKALLKTS